MSRFVRKVTVHLEGRAEGDNVLERALDRAFYAAKAANGSGTLRDWLDVGTEVRWAVATRWYVWGIPLPRSWDPVPPRWMLSPVRWVLRTWHSARGRA